MTKPLNEAFWIRWKAAWRMSRRLGQDFAEHLNQAGMLLTPARRNEVIAGELRRAALELENLSAVHLLHDDGRSGSNALDMQRATVTWLRRRADWIERQDG